MSPVWRRAPLALAGILAAAVLPAAEAPRPPNIIVILADDLGYGDLGCYGQQQIRTPRLDRLAAEGMRFTQAYAGSTVCAPSRCVLMTGRNVGRATVRGNQSALTPPRPPALAAGDVTVAAVLRAAGYATGLVGKWGLGEPGAAAAGLPARHGFDTSFGFLNQTHAHNSWPSFLWRDEVRVPLRNVVPGELPSGAGVAEQRVEFAPALFEREALAFIRAHQSAPFFLYLALTQPHANNERRPDGIEADDLGEYADRDWPAPQRAYAALVSGLDRATGRVVDLLRELGLEENTLVLFTSDNGPHREGGADPAFFGSSGGLRGHKRDLYEGGVRVPAIAWWPGRIPAGRTSDTPWYFADVLPTLAEIAGRPVPAGVDGTSLLPLFLGRGQPALRDRPIYWEFFENGYKCAVRQGEWKAVRNAPGAPVELYNLASDPAEARDVAAAHPETARRLETVMRDSHQPSPAWPIAAAR